MRTGLLILLGLLIAGAGVSLAQPAPKDRSSPSGAEEVADPTPTPSDANCVGDWLDHWSCVLGKDNGSEHPSDRSWFTAEYLLWWPNTGPVNIPLVTTGPATATVLGGISQKTTQYLVQGMEYGTASGLRLDGGWWVDRDRHLGLEAAYFVLERQAQGFNPASDANGNPVLAQPVIDPVSGTDFTEVIALPSFITGGVTVTSHSRFQGGEANALTNVLSGPWCSAYLLGGFRVLNLDEDLQIATAFAPLLDQFLTFEGQLINTPSSLSTVDSFRTQNRFYGGQLGGRVDWNVGRFDLSLLAKLALGDTQQRVQIEGVSSLLTPGAPTVTVPGGVLALPTNMGHYARDQFALVPDLGLRVAYQLTDHLQVHLGYSFLYWTPVVRPGKQIDPAVQSGLVPTDPLFGTATGTRPTFLFHNTNYTVQGFTFGLTFLF